MSKQFIMWVACHVTFSSDGQLGRMIVQMREKGEKGEKEMKFNFQQELMNFNLQNK